MALLASEAMRGGYVVNTTTGYPSMTTDATGATIQGGLLRDPDGRLVVKYA